jgi:hypothetical protein
MVNFRKKKHEIIFHGSRVMALKGFGIYTLWGVLASGYAGFVGPLNFKL